MWFGTEDGLNRYDGYNFKIFAFDPDDSTSLSDNTIQAIYEDRTGVLWIGTRRGGLNKFDHETEKFTIYQNVPNDPYSLSYNEVTSICEDSHGMLWIGIDGVGINRFDPVAEKFICYTHKWNNPNSISGYKTWSVHIDRFSFLWIATEDGGLNKLDLNKPENSNPQTSRFIHYLHNPNNRYSLSHNDVRFIHEDVSGVIWIGTGNGGVNRYDRKKNHFIHFKNEHQNEQSLSHNFVKAIYRDQTGALWEKVLLITHNLLDVCILY